MPHGRDMAPSSQQAFTRRQHRGISIAVHHCADWHCAAAHNPGLPKNPTACCGPRGAACMHAVHGCMPQGVACMRCGACPRALHACMRCMSIHPPACTHTATTLATAGLPHPSAQLSTMCTRHTLPRAHTCTHVTCSQTSNASRLTRPAVSSGGAQACSLHHDRIVPPPPPPLPSPGCTSSAQTGPWRGRASPLAPMAHVCVPPPLPLPPPVLQGWWGSSFRGGRTSRSSRSPARPRASRTSIARIPIWTRACRSSRCEPPPGGRGVKAGARRRTQPCRHAGARTSPPINASPAHPLPSCHNAARLSRCMHTPAPIGS